MPQTPHCPGTSSVLIFPLTADSPPVPTYQDAPGLPVLLDHEVGFMQSGIIKRCDYCSAEIHMTDLICKACGHRVNTPVRTVLSTIVLSALVMLALAVMAGLLILLVEPVRFL
jgi:hypothetical protein